MTEMELFVLLFRNMVTDLLGYSLDTGNIFLMDLRCVSELPSAFSFLIFTMQYCSDVIVEAVYLLCRVMIKTFFLCYANCKKY